SAPGHGRAYLNQLSSRRCGGSGTRGDGMAAQSLRQPPRNKPANRLGIVNPSRVAISCSQMRDIISSIEGEWRRYKALGEGAMRQLRDDELGRSGPGGGNSVAVIVWHIAGNLKSRFSDFLNADGEKPWRHRDSEFQPRDDVTRVELFEQWNAGWSTLL